MKKERPQFKLKYSAGRKKGKIKNVQNGEHTTKRPNYWSLFSIGIIMIALGLFIIIFGSATMYVNTWGILEADRGYALLIGIAIIFGGIKAIRYSYKV